MREEGKYIMTSSIQSLDSVFSTYGYDLLLFLNIGRIGVPGPYAENEVG